MAVSQAKDKEPLLPLAPTGTDREASKPAAQPEITYVVLEPRASSVAFAVVLFGTMGAGMLVLNKLAIHLLPAPSFVLVCQLLTCAVFVIVGDRLGGLTAERFEWPKVKAFVPVALGFVGSVYSNIKILQYANVETFIMFRSSTPLVISVLDYVFLGRELPSLRTLASLLGMVLGAVGYVLTDSNFHVTAYSWVAAWMAVFAFDQIYIKHVVDSVEMTQWGRVLYSNALALPPLLLMLLLTGEHTMLAGFRWSLASLLALAATCAASILMAYSSYLLRSLVSATSFTVVGILCKVGTLVINLAMWDQHASAAGMACVMLSIGAGAFYRQAPLRKSGGR
eukprot:jgi/Mesvir1/7883/Mv11816-RA.1